MYLQQDKADNLRTAAEMLPTLSPGETMDACYKAVDTMHRLRDQQASTIAPPLKRTTPENNRMMRIARLKALAISRGEYRQAK